MSIALALLACALLHCLIPRQLSVVTDTVGLPTFSNFNIDYLYTSYGLWTIVFPLLLTLLAKLPKTNAPDGVPAPRATSLRRQIVESVLCSFFIGLPMGLIIGMVSVPFGGHLLLVALCSTTIYTLCAVYFGMQGEAGLSSLRKTTNRPNAVVALVSLSGLVAVSEYTTVRVPSGIVSVPWVSAFAALSIVLIAFGVLACVTQRFASEETNLQILLFVSLPFLIFLLRVQLFRNLPEMDYFHEGEMTVPGALLFEHWLPWKDIVAIHGLLHDVSIYVLGRVLFEDSRWGMHCAMLLLCYPLYWISSYFLHLVLFRQQWKVAVLSNCFLPFWIPRFFDHPLYRFLFFPIVFALFIKVLREGSWLWIFAFAFVIGVQAIVSPEASFLMPGFGLALILYEIPSRQFFRTGRLVLAGIVLAAFTALLLHQFGLLDPFFEYYRNFSKDHRYARAIPFRTQGAWYWICASGPPIVLVLFFSYIGMKWRRDKALSEREALFFALAVFLMLYYQKFLARTDGHVFEPWTMSLPLVFFFGEKVHAMARGFARYVTVASAVLLATLLFSEGDGNLVGPFARAQSLWKRLNVAAPDSTDWERNGFAELPESAQLRMRDFEKLFQVYLGPRDRIHDFTSQTGLFHYLLKREPASRYFNQLFVHSERSQLKQIEELREHQPKLVIFHTPHSWTTNFDKIPAQVRHYRVAEYLWRNYEPLLVLNDFLVLKHHGLKARRLPLFEGVASSKNLYLEAGHCDWGLAPTFFPPSAVPNDEGVSFRRVGKHGIRIDLPRANTDYSEIEFTLATETDAKFILDRKPRIEMDDLDQIQFQSRQGGGTTLRIPVAACAQWHRAQTRTLYLWQSVPIDVVQIRGRRVAPGLLITQSMSKF